MNNFKKVTKYNKDVILFWDSEEKPHTCSIRTYWITWDKAIIIAENLGDKYYQKLRNITREIINFINQKYKLSSDKIMLIEYYSDDNSSNKKMYCQVLLTNYGFIRYIIDEKELIPLIKNT